MYICHVHPSDPYVCTPSILLHPVVRGLLAYPTSWYGHRAVHFSNDTEYLSSAAEHCACPAQVYGLLDRLYRKFDLLADKYGLYKVETIGDA